MAILFKRPKGKPQNRYNSRTMSQASALPPPEAPAKEVPISALQDAKSPWNSLEICKLLVSLLTPLVLFIATVQFNSIKDSEIQKQERVRRAVGKRVEMWEKLASPMNDIYCYFLYVGRWKEIGPREVIRNKRDLDALMYANQIFFSPEFFESYQAFTRAAFQTFRGWGQDAGLRTIPTLLPFELPRSL